MQMGRKPAGGASSEGRVERQRARGGALVGAQLVDTEREGVAYIVNQLQLAFRAHVQRYYGNLALLSH